MGFVGDIVGDVFGGDDAADAAVQGSQIQAQAQREALDYLKQTEAVPQAFREEGLRRLGGLYGLPGGEGSQQELIKQAQLSPLYQAIIGTQEAGEDAILRQASATGGLRSGSVQAALADQAQSLEERALLEAYGQQLTGLTGLAQLPSSASEISRQQAAIGQTLGQGTVAAGQAQQSATGQGLGVLGGLGGAVINAGGISNLASMFGFSDRRLKKNVKKVGEENGFNVYEWEWNKLAKDALGLTGKTIGHMADEVEFKIPDAVKFFNGYKTVDYDMVANNGN